MYAVAVINNIANWYAWPVFDWIFGSRIEVHCVDLPTRRTSNVPRRLENQYKLLVPMRSAKMALR